MTETYDLIVGIMIIRHKAILFLPSHYQTHVLAALCQNSEILIYMSGVYMTYHILVTPEMSGLDTFF